MIHLKPCSNCLRARQRIKNMALIMSKRWSKTYLLVQCQNGDLTILNSTKRITACPAFPDLIGVEVYIGGHHVIDVESALPVMKLGTIVKLDAVN